MAWDTRPAIPEADAQGSRLLRWWRGSLRVRVITSTVLLGTLLALLLGSAIYQQVATGLVEQAVDSAERDASQQVARAQQAFDSTDRRDDSGLRELAYEQTVTTAGPDQDDGRWVLLTPALLNEGDAIVESMATPGLDAGDIPRSVTEAIDADPENQQVMVVPVGLGEGQEPQTSVVVGSRVSLLRAGAYDLVLVYPLIREQETLDLVRQLFLLGGLGLVGLVAGLAFLATRMVTQPVETVAQAAHELALGHLDERLPVVGTDEIAQLATSFNTMADSIQHQIRELRSLSQLQQRFVSDVSHELRTPLTTMRMAGDVLHASREDFSAPVARSAELLDQELNRFEDLLAELLEISRFDSGAATVERHEEDIVPLVRAAVDGVEALAARLGSSVVVTAPPQRVEVCMDGRRISRVLRNLLTNALEHGEGRPVEVTVAASAEVASVSVRDHGIGLTEDQQRQVFDRFWRADPARTRTTGGTGLGLAIALEDARVHGGWLQVGSKPGQGACFRLVLPRSHTHVIAEQPGPVPSPGAPADAPSGDGEARTGRDRAVPPVVLALATREDPA